MIRYKSTRGNKAQYTFSEAILKGIAPDGGLLIPDKIPAFSLDQLHNLINASYAERALFILDLFETDILRERLKTLTEKAYSEKNNFFDPNITKLIHHKENEYILELWHGPTWAFKDIALQLMPLLFSEAVTMNNAKRLQQNKKPLEYLILVATSGDTGKAALEGYKNKEHVAIIVFFPDKRVSSIQEVSMVTQDGENVGVYALLGDFDDTQQIVKQIFNDSDFTAKLIERSGVALSAANSINWGRFLPQIIYHISGYLDLVKQGVITMGQAIDIAIPSGNFSNMLAAWIAKTMGLPVRKFICASNENNVLTEFFHDGIFDAAKRTMIATPSPAMDILIPSNLERLLYFMTRDSGKIHRWMEEVKKKRKFIIDDDVKQTLQALFYADWVSNADCLQTIKQTFDETGYLIDPHTAVVKEVVNRYKKQYSDNIPIVICSTAHWAKFPYDVYKALFGTSDQNMDDFEMIEKIQQKTHAAIPENLLELKDMPVVHTKKLDASKEVVEKEIEKFIQSHL